MNEQLIREITQKVLTQLNSSLPHSPQTNLIPIGVSNRHVHLCRAHMDILFGSGSELTYMKELMGGQYAAEECITIVGAKQRFIQNVRVLGPLRPETQVEVSKTDGFSLGIKPPIRDSGDLKNSAAITLIGPKGAVTLNEGCIIARRHIHMSLADAAHFNVSDKEIVHINIDNNRGGILTNVLIRVDHSFTLQMHIDTDEANAFDINNDDGASLIKT